MNPRIFSVLIVLISSLLLGACQTSKTTVTVAATETNIPATATNTPKPTKIPTRYPVPNYSFNIEEEGDNLTFENGSPIPMVATFYKNQFLAKQCQLDSETGSSMDALILVFKQCENVDSLRVIIYAHPQNNGSVISIGPDN